MPDADSHPEVTMTDEDDHSHPIFAALYDPFTSWVERTVFREHRTELVADLEGNVLDVGSGTGAMFPFFESAVEQGGSVSLHGIEPDPHMLRRAITDARTRDLDISLRRAEAESLPYDDESFDVVVATLVFCTIPNVDEALTEIARVLRPDGEFRFFEHVADDGLHGRVQSAVNPLWKRCVGGCNLDRDTRDEFQTCRRFRVVEMEEFDSPLPLVDPLIRGRLRPR